MKFVSVAITVLASLSPTNALQESADIYYHEKQGVGASMWHFSPDGLTIYAPDGKSVIKKHRKQQLCGKEDCNFFHSRSDGHKYVWAASLSASKIDIFDIDTGDHVGYQPTCSTPLDLQYHSSRREMWVRCAGNAPAAGSIDVFSSDSISTGHSEINFNTTGRQYGRMATHPSMQGMAYATRYNENSILELDISSRTVAGKHEIPKANGAYAISYSPVNEHLYIRSRICCSCGFEGAELPECGSRVSQELVQLGPNASPNVQNASCGTSCLGTAADTLGIIEFNSVSNTIVAYHNIKEGTGLGAEPISSPHGEYILFLPFDGGQYVRVVTPGANGASSSIAVDIPVDFSGGTEGKTVVSDVAFVKDADRNILVIAASSDNDVVLVDMNDNYRTVKLSLTNEEETTGGTGRNVEWAVGTQYVWVDGGEALHQYIIDLGDGIDDAKVTNTLSNVTSGNILFVNNYQRLADAQDEMELMTRMVDATNQLVSESEEEEVKSMSVAALVIGSIALAMAMGLLFTKLVNNEPASSAPAREQAPNDDEEKTLGSKRVA